MFGIGPMELLVIAIVAIVFVGPQRLPEMMRKFGRMFVQVRRQTQDIRNSFNDVIRDAERELELERIRELKQQVDQIKNKNLLDVAAKEIEKADEPESKKPEKKSDSPYEYHAPHDDDGEFVRTDGEHMPKDLVDYAKLRAREEEAKQQQAMQQSSSDSAEAPKPEAVSTQAPQVRPDRDQEPSFDTPLEPPSDQSPPKKS